MEQSRVQCRREGNPFFDPLSRGGKLIEACVLSTSFDVLIRGALEVQGAHAV